MPSLKRGQRAEGQLHRLAGPPDPSAWSSLFLSLTLANERGLVSAPSEVRPCAPAREQAALPLNPELGGPPALTVASSRPGSHGCSVVFDSYFSHSHNRAGKSLPPPVSPSRVLQLLTGLLALRH